MTKLINISRLAKLTAVLAASAALMSSAANAKGDHHQSNNMQNTGPRPHFVISGQPANVKRVTRATKKKEMAEKKKGCGKIIVPTAECGVSSKNPVGSTIPTLPPQAKGPSPAYTSVALSNGVTTSAIFNGKGLTVTSTTPGTITVSNGTNSVTMPGGTMNLSGAISVQAGAGIQLLRHPNGDVTVAANPTVTSAPTKPTSGANNGPPGVSATDNLKDLGKTAGNGLATAVVSPVAVVDGVGLTVGGALVGLAEGHPIKTTKEGAGEIWSDVSKVIDWAGGWF